MSIATQNLLRQIGSGYGGTNTYDPYSIYSALLGEAAGELQSRKYTDQFALEKEKFGETKRQFDVGESRLQKQLDEMIKESNVRNTMNLAQRGFGTQSELNKFGQGFGLSYTPATPQIGTGLAGSEVGGGGTGGGYGSLQNMVSLYKQISPYATRSNWGRSNILYDPTLSKLSEQLSKALIGYRM